MSPFYLALLHLACVGEPPSENGPEATTQPPLQADGDLDSAEELEPSAELCDDGLDNDRDGLTDASDPDCPLAGETATSVADVTVEGTGRAVLDVDGDGVKDLLYRERVEGTNPYRAIDWQGNALSFYLMPPDEKSLSLSGDLTGDGIEDWFTTEWSMEDGTGVVEIFAGPLTGYEDAAPAHIWGQPDMEVGMLHAVPDLDADGSPDLLAVYGEPGGGLYLLSSSNADGTNIGDEHIAYLENDAAGYLGAAVETGDLDGDGVSELVVWDRDWPEPFYNQLGRLLIIPSTVTGDLPVSDAAEAVLVSETVTYRAIRDFAVVEDLTGDGLDDLLVALAMDGAVLLEGSALLGELGMDDMTAAAHTRYTPSWVSGVAAAGDVDGDGRGDVALDLGDDGDFGENRVVLYVEASGGSLAESEATLSVASAWSFSGGFDADSDGLAELVFAEANSLFLFYGR